MSEKQGGPTVKTVERDWLKRTFHLTGRPGAVVEYDARAAALGGKEHWPAVLVGGSPVPTRAQGTHARHRLFFVVQPPKRGIHATIEAELSEEGSEITLKSLKLVVAGAVVYEETGGSTVVSGQWAVVSEEGAAGGDQ